MKKILILSFLITAGIVNTVQAQYATKKVKTKHQLYTDSLKAVKYDFMFPILGQAAYKQGFDIPYPIGMMANYMWLEQGIVIDNMELGLKTDSIDLPLTPVDFIQFGENKNTSYTVNVRPDVWVFPFLNVYGIFGKGRSVTEVNLVAPVAFRSVVDQSVSTAGVGLLTAFGIGPLWTSIDANWTWNKPELLDQAVRVNVLGIRLGHTFTFAQKPSRNVAVWVGGMRVKMNSETSGAVTMSDALPQETWDRKNEIVTDYNYWYDNEATPREKIIADKTLTPIVERLENADGDAVIRYGMDKQVKEMWNMSLGAQFQLNKNWMVRSEGGFIGDRKSFLLSLNYRFLGIKKMGN